MQPGRPIMALFGRVVRPIQRFLALEAASGILLLGAALAALAWSNLHAASYRGVFDVPIVIAAGDASVRLTPLAIINDGLMAIVFLVVGMEIKRELVTGELRTPARAGLPALAALGGIGFTVALFIAGLAFAHAPGLLDQAKLGILAAVGFLLLRRHAMPPPAGH